MAKGKRPKVSRKRIGIGVVVLIFLVAVVMSGGQDLNLADPFTGGLDFRDTELSYTLFSLADVQNLKQLVRGTDVEILNKQCFLKLHTSAELENGQIIPLDSPFQEFQTLFPFALQTPSGANIEQFRDIEIRLRCDAVEKLDGSQYEWEVIPRPSNPLTLEVLAYNQQGQLAKLRGGSYAPQFECNIAGFDCFGLAFTFFDQQAININLERPVKFGNFPEISNPLDPNKGIFPTSELAISKGIKFTADDLERAIEDSTSLSPATFTSEVQFRVSGAFDINFPELRDAGITFPNQIPIDQSVLINKMDIRVTEGVGAGEGTPALLPSLESKITSFEGLNSEGEFVTDFSADFSPLRVFVTMENYNEGEDGRRPTGKIFFTLDAFKTPVSTTGFGCSKISQSGLVSKFACQFNLQNNLPVGDYTVRIDSLDPDRIGAFKSFIVVRVNAPVGQDNGCADGFVPSLGGAFFGLNCVRFGTTGTGTFGTTCLVGQVKDPNTEACIVPSGETGGDEQNPCPTQGETRNQFGDCVDTRGTGGVDTRSCLNCQMNVIRVVALTDVCPVFQCEGDTSTTPEGIPNCTDMKPADIIDGKPNCNRIIGFLGGLLPILVDCEGENRTASIEQGEICVPSWVIGLFENIPALLIGGIILIIVIIIVMFLVKSSPAYRVGSGVRNLKW